MDSEMMRALEADGEKLRQLTGEDHGPYYFVPHFVERPVVASQKPAPTTNPADAFRNMFAILHNLDARDVAGIASDNNPWAIDDLTTFVLKLDDARLDALWTLVNDRQPDRYKERKAV